jgi:uncharacterized Zn-binding protein involved in type VI secretion
MMEDNMPPAAKQGDVIQAVDTHIVMVPTPGGEAPVPLPHPYAGTINSGCSTNVNIMGKPAATVGSSSSFNHIPQGIRFQTQPTGMGRVVMGSSSVFINNKPAARMGDACETCNDPAPLPVGKIVCAGSVNIGG